MKTDKASLLLQRQLNELTLHPIDGFSAGLGKDDDLFKWESPPTYPDHPPKMWFKTDIWHPNIGRDGSVCISILHEPGDDQFGYETAAERWVPVHTVESIVISVISMLSDPNDQSPANVDAAVEWRQDYNGEFRRKVLQCVKKSAASFD
ncbi:Ubiquitin-conjugating enzyme E2 G1 [Thelohanellus kitauei]|uniref:Ubiquitin-conjugating enzyme E2 G1 n=1 Tax=Thelohanellus kitauei TaxID=669202 RepID=A0A0C2J968_THEKT|nr:Ubiquitin-conjugating enzyme E2 G1 [Thelohanellus kitauei]